MKRRGKRIALVVGVALLALVAYVAFHYERVLDLIYALRTGYDFVWMPEGVSPPPPAARVLNESGDVAVNDRRARPSGESSRAACWSQRPEISFRITTVGSRLS